MGRVAAAMRRLGRTLPALQQSPIWTDNYARISCDAAETLWLTRQIDFIEIVAASLHDKVIALDLKYPMADGRLALARLYALLGRCDDARDWFARSRTILDEQGARPLRAIVDYDQALMYARRAASGDRERSAPLLEAALVQFRAIGMPGWIRRAEHLLESGTGGRRRQSPSPAPADPASNRRLPSHSRRYSAARASSGRSRIPARSCV